MFPDTGVWVEPLRPYYLGGGEKIRVCPRATKSENEGARGALAAWDVLNEHTDVPEVFRSSYAINNWIYNIPSGMDRLWGHPVQPNWRKHSVSGYALTNIPLFLGGGGGEGIRMIKESIIDLHQRKMLMGMEWDGLQ